MFENMTYVYDFFLSFRFPTIPCGAQDSLLVGLEEPYGVPKVELICCVQSK